MDRHELNEHLMDVVDQLTQSVLDQPMMRHLNQVYLPNRDAIVGCIGKLRQLLFPGYFGKQGLTSSNVRIRIGELVLELTEALYEQIRFCLRYRESLSASATDNRCDECDRQAAQVVATFFKRLPDVRAVLALDVQAAFDGDPAAQNTDETIYSY